MLNLEIHPGDFKAVGASRLSASAKYIATLMLATGARSAAELRDLSGLAKTTVYRVMSEIFASPVAALFADFPSSPDSPAIPADGNHSIPSSPADGKITEKTVPLVPLAGIAGQAPSCARDITTRATKELPTEVVFEDNITPSFPQPRKQTAKRGSRLPEDWELPDDWRQWALVNCPATSPDLVEREAMIFANYWQSQPGQKACKLDWSKTWKNWCLKAFARGPVRSAPSAPATNWYEEEARKRKEFYALATGGALHG